MKTTHLLVVLSVLTGLALKAAAFMPTSQKVGPPPTLKDHAADAVDTVNTFVPFNKQDTKGLDSLAKGLRKGDNIIQYGNWYGPGWWGGARDPGKPGGKPPVDELDATAQRHDFGYQVAERMGKIYGKAEELRLKAIADAICVRDAMKLDPDPSKWNPPAADPEKADRYRNRIITGFTYESSGYDVAGTIGLGADWVTSPIENWELDRSHQLNQADMEKQVNSLVKNWNKTNPPANEGNESAGGKSSGGGGGADTGAAGGKSSGGGGGADTGAAGGKSSGGGGGADTGAAGGKNGDGGDSDAGKVSNEAGEKVGTGGYEEGATVVDKEGDEYVNKGGQWKPTGENYGKVDPKTKEKWDKELNGDDKEKEGAEGKEGGDLKGNEAEAGEFEGGDDGAKETAVGGFTDDKAKTQDRKVWNGLDGMAGQKDVNDATTSGDEADQAAKNTLNQGGAAAKDLKDKTAADTAAEDAKDGWDDAIGNGVADGVKQGADALGAAIGQGAADNAWKKKKKKGTSKTGDTTGDGAEVDDPADTPAPPDGGGDGGVKTAGGSKKNEGAKNKNGGNGGNKGAKDGGRKTGDKKGTTTQAAGNKITVTTTGDATDSSSGGYAAGPQDKVISVGSQLAGKKVTGCRVRVTYDARSIPDTFQVVYDGGVIASSGSVSYGGSLTAKGKGSTPRVTIRVISSSDQGTVWSWSATVTFFVMDEKVPVPPGGGGKGNGGSGGKNKAGVTQ
ncbi:MAG: hypothetical protein R6X19_11835 [Kiritimatiellia bacterium]